MPILASIVYSSSLQTCPVSLFLESCMMTENPMSPYFLVWIEMPCSQRALSNTLIFLGSKEPDRVSAWAISPVPLRVTHIVNTILQKVNETCGPHREG